MELTFCDFYNVILYMENKRRKSIFQFNHIDPSISKDNLHEIKNLHKYYHILLCYIIQILFWCYKQAYKYFKR